MESKKLRHVTRDKAKKFKLQYKMLNKKAVSGVVVMVVMIALVISISAIVFTLTKKTVEEKTKKSEACGLEIIDKLSINSEYVCYDSINNEIVFSINRGDIDLDKLIIAVETETAVRQFEMTDAAKTFPDLISYPNRESEIKMPNKKGTRQ